MYCSHFLFLFLFFLSFCLLLCQAVFRWPACFLRFFFVLKESSTLQYSKKFKFRRSHQRCSMKKGALKNFAKFLGKHLCQGLFFNKVAGLSCEFCEISKNTFSTEHLWTTPSVSSSNSFQQKSCCDNF